MDWTLTARVTVALMLTALASTRAEAQHRSDPSTVLTRPTAAMLLAPAGNAPLSCVLQRGSEPQLERQGINTRYYFQLPFTLRQGTLGLDAAGTPRFLLVSIEVGGSPWTEYHSASATFRPSGDLEVGRRAIRFVGEGAPPESVGGLSAADAAAMIRLARELTARCRQ